MGHARQTAVAGTFYPAGPSELAAAVAFHLDQARAASDPADPRPAPKAIIVPHAGYLYSGPVAAHAYAAEHDLVGIVERVVLLGPAHFVYLQGIVAPVAGTFETPLGPFRVDSAAISAIVDLPGLMLDDAPHEPEHCLEVQLPFLRQTLGEVAVVPLLVGDIGPAPVARVLERLWGGRETLIVVSTDLSHYHTYGEARRLDMATAAAIEALDGSRLSSEDACGVHALAGFLQVARNKGLIIERLDLRNSGDTAGPSDRVVGYGAWALREPADVP